MISRVTGETIGEVLAFSAGVALSPLAIVAAVVLLVSPRGARPAWLFLSGWVAALTVVTTVVVLIADEADASANGKPASWVSIVKILVALLLVGFGVHGWRGRDGEGEGEGEGTNPPGWMRKLDDVTAAKAAGLGVLFGAVKPKNLLLSVGAGMAVAQVGAAAASQIAGVAAFVLLGSAGVAAPYAISLVMPRHGHDRLIRLRDWMVRENATIIAVISIVIAAKLLGDALVSLAG